MVGEGYCVVSVIEIVARGILGLFCAVGYTCVNVKTELEIFFTVNDFHIITVKLLYLYT